MIIYTCPSSQKESRTCRNPAQLAPSSASLASRRWSTDRLSAADDDNDDYDGDLGDGDDGDDGLASRR